MGPVVGEAIIALIQVVTELAKEHGMTQEQMEQHFNESWEKLKNRPANDLPKA